MSLPKIATPEEHLAARKKLLICEKELNDLRDELNTQRRNLPMVEVTKDYHPHGQVGQVGQVGLIDLFERRPQPVVYHFMFDPEWDDRCPSCTAGTDGEGGLLQPTRRKEKIGRWAEMKRSR